ncbi:very short patch repair endonuclease [Mycobacterium sp. 141]|uniref:very short patch repair endonuclease n=1 Tax=Mycobacterium sp. 141 TaxID=1120797 RepID=UPI0009DA5277|nr:very short patch repair endonuclease [Mycobacterium sp. 141]
MLANRSRDTRPEVALRRELHRLGLRYRVNTRPIPQIRRTADVVFPRRKVAVFLDGCFWHGCPDHYTAPRANATFWREKLRRNVARDRQVDEVLVEAGWRVLRVWEHESPAPAAARIAQIVRERPPR